MLAGSTKAAKLLAALAMAFFGLIAIFSYQTILTLVLNAALLFTFFTGFYRIYQGIHYQKQLDLISGIISLSLGTVLLFYGFIPEWLIRVSFGTYCLLAGLSILIQQCIYISNQIRPPLSGWIFTAAYLALGSQLLFHPTVSTQLLMQCFGVYFLLLAGRYTMDTLDRDSVHYHWRRWVHISLPALLAPFIPDYYLSQINHHFQKSDSLPAAAWKRDEKPKLRAMVHVGPEGFQKVGHFSFSWKDIVYSYGNYDVSSVKLGGLMGDGVYFTVPFEQYLPNIMKYENNTIFEYGIHTTPEQDEQIEAALDSLINNSYRWYCAIERDPKLGDIEPHEKDYPCRLHYRTGAKFYKIQRGRFRTYWATGENCVLFADRILGVIGADVLSVRGIVSPGTYFAYLENEYAKKNSPIISRVIHTNPACDQEQSN